MKAILQKKTLLILSGAVGGLHALLCLLRYYVTVDALWPVDYILGGVLAAAALGYYILWRPKIRFCAEQVLLLVLMGWYLLSCAVMNSQYDSDWFAYNERPLFDTAVSLLLLYPLGRFAAKNNGRKIALMVLHAAVIAWTVFMVYVLACVFQNKIIFTPNGGQIGMNARPSLCLNSNPNTTGVFAGLFFMLSACMIFWVRHPALKAVYILSAIVHYFVLVLSNSRTSLLSAMLGFMAIAAVVTYQMKKTGTLRARLLLSATVAIAAGAAFYFLRRPAYTLYYSISHANKALSAYNLKDMGGTTTFSGRTKIWALSLKAMVSTPQRFLTGVTPPGVPALIKHLSDGKYNMYTHNQFLEMGVALGVPGLCLYLGWFGLLVRNCLRLIFRKKTEYAAWLIPAVLLMLAVNNTMEATLLFYQFLSGHIFLFLAGWVQGKAEPDVPAKLSRQAARQRARKKK